MGARAKKLILVLKSEQSDQVEQLAEVLWTAHHPDRNPWALAKEVSPVTAQGYYAMAKAALEWWI